MVAPLRGVPSPGGDDSGLRAMSQQWQKKAAIGPDAWYHDDFDYDKAVFSDNDHHLLDSFHLVDEVEDEAAAAGQEASSQGQEGAVKVSVKNVPGSASRRLKDDGRSLTWHGDKFAQMLTPQPKDQRARTQREGGPDFSSPEWSPAKTFEAVRRIKEAPPNNVVQDRLRRFQQDQGLPRRPKVSCSPIKDGESTSPARSMEEARRRFFSPGQPFQAVVVDNACPEKESGTRSRQPESSREEPGQRKRSVKELLSDFERKSGQDIGEDPQKKAFPEDNNSSHQQGSNRRRGFSDTETMMYDDSSLEAEEDDDEDDEEAFFQVQAKGAQKKPPALPPRRTEQREPELVPQGCGRGEEDASSSPYVAMTPPSATKLFWGGSQTLSLTSSIHSSSNQSGKDGGPAEGAAAGLLLPDNHDRTPSLTLIMEHLLQEQGAAEPPTVAPSGPSAEEAYVQMSDSKEASAVLAKDQPESPRYCEIDEEPPDQLRRRLPPSRSHYEYLYKARSADLPLAAESVYHEIMEEADAGSASGLPDVLGETQSRPHHHGKGHSSSDADDESPSKEQATKNASGKTSKAVAASSTSVTSKIAAVSSSSSASKKTSKSLFEVSDSFKPASFFLDKADKRDQRGQPRQEQQQQQPEKVRRPSSVNRPLTRGILQQDINLTYQSVYEEDASSSDCKKASSDEDATTAAAFAAAVLAKTPYYVSEIGHVRREDLAAGGVRQPDHPPRVGQPDPLAEKAKRSRTPDTSLEAGPPQSEAVPRSRSLEGLLGDGPQDTLLVRLNLHQTQQQQTAKASTPAPSDPPPPPPPGRREDAEDDDNEEDIAAWRENLRKASVRQQRSRMATATPLAQEEPRDVKERHQDAATEDRQYLLNPAAIMQQYHRQPDEEDRVEDSHVNHWDDSNQQQRYYLRPSSWTLSAPGQGPATERHHLAAFAAPGPFLADGLPNDSKVSTLPGDFSSSTATLDRPCLDGEDGRRRGEQATAPPSRRGSAAAPPTYPRPRPIGQDSGEAQRAASRDSEDRSLGGSADRGETQLGRPHLTQHCEEAHHGRGHLPQVADPGPGHWQQPSLTEEDPLLMVTQSGE